MRLLITGASGFVGRHMVEHARAVGDLVFATVQTPPTVPLPVASFSADLTDRAAVVEVLERCRPEGIIHLAGYANAGKSFAEPEAAWRANLTATLSLYSAVEKWDCRPRILYVSSGMVYGTALESGRTCDEETPLLPNSPYGASKAAADLASYQWFCHPGLPIIRVRPFNQIGPGQATGFAVADFAAQIARIEVGLSPPVLETGNLDAERDLTDVRDMVRAYRLLLDQGMPGEVYNAGRGAAISMRAVVNALIELSGRPIEVQTRADRLRPTEVTRICSEVTKLHATTGWVPEIPLQTTLEDVLKDWRRRVTMEVN